MEMKKTSLLWRNLFLITFLGAYLYIFNEWLFAITKPSFMNGLSFTQQLQIFFTISALLTGLIFLCLLPLLILSLLPLFKTYTDLLIKLGGLLPAGIYAVLILLLVDNFTYTVFKFGIVSTEGWSRGLYGLVFILLIVVCYRQILKSLVRMSRQTRIWGFAPEWIYRLLAGVLVLSVAVLVFPNQARPPSPLRGSPEEAHFRPHILLITADGVNASHMSVYGYGRDTTPNLQELAKSSLVAENAFSNADHTTGSVISIYTGKYPTKTRLFYSHNILKGVDAYEHLPGILRSQGYRTVQITVPILLDAGKLNLVNGFDEVKMSSAVHTKYLDMISKTLPIDKALFIDEILNRITDRIRHIFFIEKMINPYLLVTRMAALSVDIVRWEHLKKEIQSAEQPIFVHIHSMVTHGDLFNPPQQQFSAGQPIERQESWSNDFYDDSILDFDKNFGELVDDLTDQGLLDNTVLIIGSDHGKQWDLYKRLPLMIRFPEGQYAGSIQANVQNLDIAPTILDYIGLEQPGWMQGTSLIMGELEQRPIFGMSAIDYELNLNSRDAINKEDLTSPFDSFHNISMIYCQTWYRLDLNNRSWDSGPVEGSTSICPPGSDITDEQAFQWIMEHLAENGFDVSILESLSPGIN
jgi:hypothetical protein